MTHFAPGGPTVPSVGAQSVDFDAPCGCGNVIRWSAVASSSAWDLSRTTVAYTLGPCPSCVVEEIA